MSCRITACALLLLATASPCALGAPVDHPPAGYHDVTVGSGGHKSVLRVQDAQAPHYRDGSTSDADSAGPYNPENMNLGQSNSMANKSFNSSFASLSKNDTAAEAHDSRQFITPSFSTRDYNQAGRKYQTVAYTESSRGSDTFSKAFALPAANTGSSQAFSVKTSEYQGKTAPEAERPSRADPFAAPSSLSEKTFYDPEMTHVRRDPYATGLDVKRMTDLPNRPLTIDEVRNLINHEQIPDLNSKPDAPSKALNDPAWQPPTVAPLAHDNLPVAPPAEMEKDGDLPAPGEMAQPPPENAEPLPK